MKKILVALVIITILLFFLAGCNNNASSPTIEDNLEETIYQNDEENVVKDSLDEKEQTEETEKEEIDLLAVKPNEMGQVMILMYHVIGEEEGTWARHYDNFKKDLQRLYDEGYRLINLRDFVNNTIDIPAGYTPVVLTFDDGTIGQFRYLEREDGETEIDPNSAVGIILEFNENNPDFGIGGTFYINYSGTPFGQARYVEEKLNKLVELGFEIGNHGHSHLNYRNSSEAEVRKDLATHAKRTAEYVDGYLQDSLALPFGIWPEDREIAYSGEYDGFKYNHQAVLNVGANPARSPNHEQFDPLNLPRVRADEEHFNKWLDYFINNPDKKYISDGDKNYITVPEDQTENINQVLLIERELRTYSKD